MEGQEHFYEVSVKWMTGRTGELVSPVLNDTIQVATPPEFAKGVPGIWSPEHLFVAAINSCYMTTFLAIAENSKLNYSTFNCTAVGKLEKVEGKFRISEVVLKPELTICDEAQKERAERVLEKSEQQCLISNSVHSKILLQPQVQIDHCVKA